MEPVVTTSALMLHNLGLAAGFGGTLFGKFALNPAVKAIPDEKERGRVLDAAWQRYKWVNGAALGSVALTWITGRSMLSGRELGRDARRLTVLKDVLLGTALLSTVVNIGAGTFLHQLEGGNLPVESGNEPSANTPERAANLQRVLKVVGTINLIAAAGVIAVTSWLNNKAAASFRWNLLSRLRLP